MRARRRGVGGIEGACLSSTASPSTGRADTATWWTTGAYDIVLVCEGPEDAMMTAALRTAALGNVRTQTLRGFSAAEMRSLVAKL